MNLLDRYKYMFGHQVKNGTSTSVTDTHRGVENGTFDAYP